MLGVLCVGCSSDKTTEVQELSPESTFTDNVIQEMPQIVKIEPKEEILEASLDSGCIQIGEEIVSFPITLKEFVEKTNATYVEKEKDPDIIGTDIFVTSNDYIISSNDMHAYAILKYDDIGANIQIEVHIPETGTASVGDLYIESISEITSENIYFPQGINCNMTVDELKDILGQETNIIEMSDGYLNYYFDINVQDEEAKQKIMSCYNVSDVIAQYSYDIDIDRETGKVLEIGEWTSFVYQ